jgi:hypothetical protein
MRIISRAIAVVIAVLVTVVAAPAYAGSPHFVNNAFEVTVDGSTLTVSGKVAGLGDETQVHIELSADASCINPGGQDPSAANKATFGAAGDFPVQNGKAEFELTVVAVFQPKCSPPMTVVWTSVTVTDAEHGLTATFTP